LRKDGEVGQGEFELIRIDQLSARAPPRPTRGSKKSLCWSRFPANAKPLSSIACHRDLPLRMSPLAQATKLVIVRPTARRAVQGRRRRDLKKSPGQTVQTFAVVNSARGSGRSAKDRPIAYRQNIQNSAAQIARPARIVTDHAMPWIWRR